MNAYRIISKAGDDYGVWNGENAKAAFLAMLADSGDADSYGEPQVGTESDWIIEEAKPPRIEYEIGCYGVKWRISDEADEADGGWCRTTYKQKDDAIIAAREYVKRSRQDLRAAELEAVRA